MTGKRRTPEPTLQDRLSADRRLHPGEAWALVLSPIAVLIIVFIISTRGG